MKRTQYFKWGLTAFLTVCAVLVFYDTFYQAGTLQQFVSKLASILAPVLYGFAIAYLLTPIMSCLERAIAALWKKLFKKELKQPSGALRLVSILLTEAVVIFLLYLLMSVLVPQVVDSVTTLINNAESYYRKVYRWANDLLESDSGIGVWLAGLITERYTDGMAFLTDKVLPWAQKAIVPLTNGIWSGIRGAVGFAFDLIVGIIVSIYLMGMKEKSLARCCKAVYAALPEENADAVMRGTRRVNAIFSGFVRGKLLDSLIIGILCFICCSILKMPYTPLVSVVVGVTNVIPFFGPFLGAVPSAFLILLVSPKQCLVFVIFIVILQQFDGNILGPKILGDATGISSFWVIVAILVGGGFAGVLGMFIGVPVFACIQELLKFLMDRRLRKRNMPTEAYAYVGRAKDSPPEDTPAPEPEDIAGRRARSPPAFSLKGAPPMTKDLYDKLMVFGNDQEPFLTHNFMRTTDLDDGTATVTLPMHTESLNRWGGAHGGILFSLCDVAMGMAIMTLRQEMVVTVNATIDYLSAAAAGSTLTTVGKVDRLGGKLAFCSAEMTDETGKVIVRAHCVMCFTGRALPL